MTYYTIGILLVGLTICHGTYINVPGTNPFFRYKIDPATEFLNGRGLREADAKAACASDGASLYWYDSEEEFQAVRAFMNSPAYDMQAKYRIGGVLANNVWIWEKSGEEIPQDLLFWADDEPNNIAGDEYCLNVRRDTNYLLNDVRCRKPMGYICKKEIPEFTAVCKLYGEPHIVPFDGPYSYDFMGECKYVLAETCLSGPSLPYFKIVGKMQKTWFTDLVTSEVKYIEIQLFGAVIRMVRELVTADIWGPARIKVIVNDEIVNRLPYNDFEPDFTIESSGVGARLRTNELDVNVKIGDYQEVNVYINVSSVYYSWMCGMCGNFDGIRDNDIPAHMTEAQFGAFHQVYDPSDPQCITDEDPEPLTPDPAFTQICEPLTDTSGPFGACVVAYPDLSEALFADCMIDMTAYAGWENQERMRCSIFESFVIQCLDFGVDTAINWRISTECVPICPEHATYTTSMSACPASCSAPNNPDNCPLPNEDGCQCDSGYILHSNGVCDTIETCPAKTCSGTSDPHFTTFDGRDYDFMGYCKYVYANVCQPGSLPLFTVIGKHVPWNRNTATSVLLYAEVRVLGFLIRFLEPSQIEVDGTNYGTPYSPAPGLDIESIGDRLKLRTDFGLIVEVEFLFDSSGYNDIYITVPHAYNSDMCGLCGNYDGISSNDVPNTIQGIAAFGSFNQIYDPLDPTCETDQNPPVIEVDFNDQELQELCNPLKDTAGPFGACVAAYPNHADGEYDNCMMDLSFGVDLDDKKELRCPIFEDFARQCLAYNIPIAIDWRALTDCITVLSCQTGFTSIHGMCYLFETFSETMWQEAVDSCEGIGAALLYINSEPELTAIRDHIKADPALLMQSRYWLSGKKVPPVTGDWHWNNVGGNDTLIDDLFWDFEEPTNEPAENCLNIQNAAIGHDYLYNDAMCTKYIGYICKAAPETP